MSRAARLSPASTPSFSKWVARLTRRRRDWCREPRWIHRARVAAAISSVGAGHFRQRTEGREMVAQGVSLGCCCGRVLPGLLAFEVVEPLLVGFGHVCQLVDELAEVGEPGGGVGEPGGGFGGAGVGPLFKVAVQGGEQFQRLCEGFEPFIDCGFFCLAVFHERGHPPLLSLSHWPTFSVEGPARNTPWARACGSGACRAALGKLVGRRD